MNKADNPLSAAILDINSLAIVWIFLLCKMLPEILCKVKKITNNFNNNIMIIIYITKKINLLLANSKCTNNNNNNNIKKRISIWDSDLKINISNITILTRSNNNKLKKIFLNTDNKCIVQD